MPLQVWNDYLGTHVVADLIPYSTCGHTLYLRGPAIPQASQYTIAETGRPWTKAKQRKEAPIVFCSTAFVAYKLYMYTTVSFPSASNLPNRKRDLVSCSYYRFGRLEQEHGMACGIYWFLAEDGFLPRGCSRRPGICGLKSIPAYKLPLLPMYSSNAVHTRIALLLFEAATPRAVSFLSFESISVKQYFFMSR